MLPSQLMANGRLITHPVTGGHAQCLVEKERQLVSFQEAVPTPVLNMAAKTVAGGTLKQKPSPVPTGSVQVIHFKIFFFKNPELYLFIGLNIVSTYCEFYVSEFSW